MNARAAAGRRRKASDIVQKPWAQIINPFKALQIISEDEVEALHGAALRILEDVGVRCQVAEARAIFAGAGAIVDESDGRVRVGREIIEVALKTVPAEITLTPRNENHAEMWGGAHMATAAVLGPPKVTDR